MASLLNKGIIRSTVDKTIRRILSVVSDGYGARKYV